MNETGCIRRRHVSGSCGRVERCRRIPLILGAQARIENADAGTWVGCDAILGVVIHLNIVLTPADQYAPGAETCFILKIETVNSGLIFVDGTKHAMKRVVAGATAVPGNQKVVGRDTPIGLDIEFAGFVVLDSLRCETEIARYSPQVFVVKAIFTRESRFPVSSLDRSCLTKLMAIPDGPGATVDIQILTGVTTLCE